MAISSFLRITFTFGTGFFYHSRCIKMPHRCPYFKEDKTLNPIESYVQIMMLFFHREWLQWDVKPQSYNMRTTWMPSLRSKPKRRPTCNIMLEMCCFFTCILLHFLFTFILLSIYWWYVPKGYCIQNTWTVTCINFGRQKKVNTNTNTWHISSYFEDLKVLNVNFSCDLFLE